MLNYFPISVVFRLKFAFILLFLFISLNMNGENGSDKRTALEEIKHFLERDKDEDGKLNSVLAKTDSILIQHNKVTDAELSRIVSSISYVYQKEGRLSLAIELFSIVIPHYEAIKNPSKEEMTRLINFYIPLGAAHEELGLWSKAMNIYLKALSLAERDGLESHQAMIFNNIGTIHYSRTELDKAKEYYQLALDINKRLGIRQELFYNYSNLASMAMDKGDYAAALNYALLAIQQVNNEENPYLYYSIQSNIGNIYIYNRDYAMALSHLRNAARYQQINDYPIDLAITYSYFRSAFEGLNQLDSAKLYCQKALDKIQETDNKRVESNLLSEMAAFYSRQGEIDKAFAYLSAANAITDSIARVDNQLKIEVLEELYDTDHQNILANIAKKNKANIRIIVISAIIIVVALLLLLYFRNKKLTKQIEANNVLAIESKERDLQLIIDEKNRELISNSLSFIKKNEFIEDIENELRIVLADLNPRDRVHKDQIKNVLNKLDAQHGEEKWEEFSYYFEKVHPSFYKLLEGNYPDLTLKERRLCSFLLLGLSSKEISAITYKEVRSVESARNRLRKKIGISTDVNIVDFLNSLNK